MSKKKEQHEEHMNESWLIPYADLLTLLLALFIVLFASSQVNAEKFAAMQAAFYGIFEGTGHIAGEGGSGVINGSGQGGADPASTLDWSQITQPAGSMSESGSNGTGQGGDGIPLSQRLSDLQGKFDDYIRDHELSGKLHTQVSADTVMIIISDIVLFDSGSARIKPDFAGTIQAIGDILADTPGLEVQIVGHTDNVPIMSSEYETNWDLSTARALNFMKTLLDDPRLDPAYYSAIGYGEYRPVAGNETAEGRALNRRVEVTARYIDR